MRKKIVLLVFLVFGLTTGYSASAETAFDADLPDVVFIEGIGARGQTFPLSCESRSAVDLAGYWGIRVKETEFFDSLPVSDNPEEGFVGSVFGAWGQTPPRPYGVHAPPIARVLQSYGLDAVAHKNMTLKELKTEIANGRPVVVWVVGHVWKGTPQEYKAKDGSVVTVAPYEHTMLAYGYDLAGVYLIDAGNGMRRGYSYKIFEESWAVLGNMAVTASGTREVPVQLKNLEKDNPGVYIVQKGDYLANLAREWGVPWRDLAEINNISWPYKIYPGQTLITGIEAADDKDVAKDGEGDQESNLAGKTTNETAGEITTSKIIGEGGEREWSALDTYIVQKSEHLVQIAEKLQLNWKTLAKLNNLPPPYDLVPGQVLLLPDFETSATDDTLVEDSSEFSGSLREYVVRKGEYLYIIARKFDVNWHVLAEVNDIGPPYFVYPGQILQIPD